MEDEDDYTRSIIRHDLDVRAYRKLQEWVRDSAMRYEAVGMHCAEPLVTCIIRVLVTTLGRAGMDKKSFMTLMARAYACFEKEQEERRAEDR